MNSTAGFIQDIMQVCFNGHVVNTRFRTCPERSRHSCDRCGAATLHACLTCNQELAGAIVVPGLQPVGTVEPPLYCARCGAVFPWQARRSRLQRTPAAGTLGHLLRQLPYTVLQLRDRWGGRTPYCIADEHDL